MASCSSAPTAPACSAEGARRRCSPARTRRSGGRTSPCGPAAVSTSSTARRWRRSPTFRPRTRTRLRSAAAGLPAVAPAKAPPDPGPQDRRPALAEQGEDDRARRGRRAVRPAERRRRQGRLRLRLALAQRDRPQGAALGPGPPRRLLAVRLAALTDDRHDHMLFVKVTRKRQYLVLKRFGGGARSLAPPGRGRAAPCGRPRSTPSVPT